MSASYALVVRSDWGTYKRGDVITDLAAVASALAARAPVNRIAAPSAPAAAPSPEPTIAEAVAAGVAAAEATLHPAS